MGVAVLFDRETTIELDGLRRALGEPDLGRIPPHLTLVPPVNVGDVDAAVRVVREAAHDSDPFEVTLGPVTTFLPDNPVVYLAVEDGDEEVHALRERVFHAPLARPLTWPFVPHVTLADGIEPDLVAAAPATLAAYRRDVQVTAIHLLEERGRVWEVLRTIPLGPAAVVGRGGQPLELETLAVDDRVVITARQDDRDAGRAEGWRRGEHVWLTKIEVNQDLRRNGIGSQLLAAFQSWAADSGATAAEVDPACELDRATAGFLAARGWVAGESSARPRRGL